MAFPTDLLPVKQQLLINDVWTDITSDTRGNNGLGGVSIVRGYSGEQASLAAGQAQFTLNNRDGKYTNGNPSSPYYRLLGRNTPYRSGIDSGVVSARYLGATATGSMLSDGSTIWTADKAALDITGDIDVAVDVDSVGSRRGVMLISKYVTASNQRSWLFQINEFGQLKIYWSIDGTSTNRLNATCPTPIDTSLGRMQLRFQLDVNNGSGGWTVTFQQSFGTSLTGTYTTIGTVSGSGTTSVFSSSARVEVGNGNNGAGFSGVLDGVDPFVGKMYGAIIRSSIGGTIVANLNVSQQTAGTTTWVDTTASTNTWTVTGSTYLESIDFRFYGEVPSLPNRWDITGTDVYIPVAANDLIARATSGNLSKPVESAVKHNLKQYPWDGYWPMEQPFDSTSISAYLGQAGRITNANFSVQPTDFPGTAGSLSFSDDTGFATATTTVNKSTSGVSTTVTTYLVYFKLATVPVTQQPIINFFLTGGTGQRITMFASTTVYGLEIAKPDGTNVVSTTSGFGGTNDPGEWTAMRLKQSISAGTVTWEWAWYQLNQPDIWGLSGTYSGSMGRPWYWSSPGWTGKFGLQLAHIAMGRLDPDFISYEFIGSTNAYHGEYWSDRARRLGGQALLPVFLEGNPTTVDQPAYSHLMGPQGLKTPIELLQEVADVAGGSLRAARDKSGIVISSWESVANQTPVTFDYAAKHLSGQLLPEPDLFLIENDVTLQTPDGSTYRYVKSAGTLNVNDPGSDADAVGTYDVGPVAINLVAPSDMPQYAQRRVAQGTWDDARYPQVQVQLERAPFVASAALTASARALDLGRTFQIVHPPSWLPPDAIGLLVSGYVETMGGYTNTLNFNTRPSGPWTSGLWRSTTFPGTSVWGAASTTLKTGVNATATSLTFTTVDPFEVWSTTASGYHVKVAGEVLTISAMGARTGSGPYSQVATVVRSANGVSKSLSAGEAIVVVEQGRWA